MKKIIVEIDIKNSEIGNDYCWNELARIFFDLYQHLNNGYFPEKIKATDESSLVKISVK